MTTGKQLEKLTLKWSVIDKLYSSIIGKCLFLLSSVALFSTIPLSIYIISSKSMAIALLGAIIISLSYVLYKIRIPNTISSYNEKEYHEFLLGLRKQNALDILHEFSILETDAQVPLLSVFENKHFKLHPFDNIENYETVLGHDRSLYFLSVIKYCLLDHSSRKSRQIVTLMFYFGCFCFYLPGIIRVLTVIVKGVS